MSFVLLGILLYVTWKNEMGILIDVGNQEGIVNFAFQVDSYGNGEKGEWGL